MSLMTKTALDEFAKRLGNPYYADLRYRRTGRSTKQAFGYIHAALCEPGVPINVRDHHGTPVADRYLLRTISDMIRALKFEHFSFNISKRTLTYTWKHPALTEGEVT